MAEYRRSAHAVFDLKYHVVWITKYRYYALKGRVAERTRDLIRQICESREVVNVRGAVWPDDVHMHGHQRIQDEFPEIRKRYRGNICGRESTSVRRSAVWTRKQC